MNRVKFLQFMCIALVLINVTLILFIATRGPRHKGALRGPKHKIIQKLKFSDDQVATYESYIKTHKGETKRINNKIRDLKKELYTGLGEDMTPEKMDSLVQLLSIEKSAIEKTHLRHFEKIKGLCTPEQLPEFKELSNDLAHFFVMPPSK